jgi:hypothetical protein
MVSEETYKAAEDSLLEWIDTCIQNKLTLTDVVFILQFRIWEINHGARAAYKESQEKK